MLHRQTNRKDPVSRATLSLLTWLAVSYCKFCYKSAAPLESHNGLDNVLHQPKVLVHLVCVPNHCVVAKLQIELATERERGAERFAGSCTYAEHQILSHL